MDSVVDKKLVFNDSLTQEKLNKSYALQTLERNQIGKTQYPTSG